MTTPERTMINGGASRHIACKPCRDRKVRCGGEQPICDKCKRAGEQCIYLPTQKPTKAELAHTVEALQKRLDEAEAYIRSTQSKAPSSTTLTTPSSCNLERRATSSAGTVLPPVADVPSAVQSGGANPALHRLNHLDLPQSQENLDFSSSGPQEPSEAVNPESTPGRQGPFGPISTDEEIDINIDNPSLDFFLRDGFTFQGGINEDTGIAVLDPIRKFSGAIFRNQAEASVMASVVADYIAWLCKAPPGGGIPAAAESPVYLGMLKTLETRLRELCDVSQSRSNNALQELVAELQMIAPPGGAMSARLSTLEEDLQKETRDRAEIFRSRYNPCAFLSEQSRNTST